MGAMLEPQVLASKDRGALAKMLLTLFDHWNLTTEDQALLLGLASTNRAALSRYRKGEPIGASRDQYDRVGHLLAIHKNLRLLFPKNRELASGTRRGSQVITPSTSVHIWMAFSLSQAPSRAAEKSDPPLPLY